MPRSSRLILLPLTALALVTSGCGEADRGRITERQASKLTASVERAEQEVQDGQCGAARAAAQTGAQRVAALKGNVDPDLRANLIEGFEHLDRRIASDCNRPDDTATPSPTAEPTETEEPTPTPTPSPSPTPTPTATPEPTVTAAPTATASPDDGTGGSGFEDDGDDDSGGSSAP